MRKAVGAAALLSLFLLVVLLTLPHNSPDGNGKAHGENGQTGPLSLAITSYELADSGNGTVAVLRMRVGGNASLSAFCQEKPLQRAFLELRHPPLPGVGEGLDSKLSSALSRAGASFLEVDAASAANYSNSVILSTSGALPHELLGAGEQLLLHNTRVVALVALEGKAIDAQGNLRQADTGSLPENFEVVGLGESEDAAISEMVRLALVPQDAGVVELDAAPGNTTLALPAKAGESCRVAASNGSAMRFADTGKLEAQSGKLLCPKSIPAGSAAGCYFSPDYESEIGRELGFAAVARDNGKVAKVSMASGTITEGYESRFSIMLPEGGKYVVHVSDQYGRMHAAAYVEALALQARLVGVEGQKHEFALEMGGEPVDGLVLVSLDRGGRKEIAASGGRLYAYAAPAPGNHTMEFSYKGASATAGFPSGQESAFSLFAKYAAAGALALAAFYLLISAGRKPKFALKFPGAQKGGLAAHEASPGGFLAAYDEADGKMGGHGLPMYADEIASCMKLGRKSEPAEPGSALCCLEELVEEGLFCEHEGAFLPKRKLRGFLPWELAALRLVHDLLLERGQRFRLQRRTVLSSGKVELCLHSPKQSPIAGMRKGVSRVILFPSEEEMGNFMMRMKGTGKEAAMLRIAYWNGAVLPVVASRKELEPLIP